MKLLRTLVVDDNKAFVVLARHLLADCRQIVLVGFGQDGFDAVRMAEELKPDLIIIDLAMPGMGGLQATRLIKAQDRPPLVCIASHYDDAAHREFAAQSGADGFINKWDYELHIGEFLRKFAPEGAHA